MSEEWGISRVGKLEVEVGETLQEAIIRLQIFPLPPPPGRIASRRRFERIKSP